MIIKNEGKSGKRTTLICTNCGEEYSELDIKIREKGSKFCSNDCYKEYRQKNKMTEEEVKASNRIQQKASKYGLSKEAYLNLFVEQDNKCLICDVEFSDFIRACVDHNHITKSVRGLLCSSCNSLIGFAKDDINILFKAISYLK